MNNRWFGWALIDGAGRMAVCVRVCTCVCVHVRVHACVRVKILAQGMLAFSSLQPHTATMRLVQESNSRSTWLQTLTVCFLTLVAILFQVDPSLTEESML